MRVILAAVVLSACGGGGGSAPELSGMYMIDSHTSSLTTCVGEGDPVTPLGFLQLAFDADFQELTWALCDTSDPTSCQEDFYGFDDVGGQWRIGAATSASYSGGSCSLLHAEGGVDRTSEQPLQVHVELKEWDDYVTEDESACTIDMAAALAQVPECQRHEVVNATAL